MMYQNTQSVSMNIRLKLSDFINTEYESIIMNKLSEIHSKLKATFYLRLWFNDDIKAGIIVCLYNTKNLYISLFKNVKNSIFI